ncbi:MAG TPA: hypothetical protein VGB94_02080 [Acidobacteriaceae bacterium]
MKPQPGNPPPKNIDPILTRKRGFLRNPGSILLTLLAVAFAAYVFGRLPQADTAYQSLLNAIDGQRSNALTIWQLAPFVGIGITILLIASYILKRLNRARKSVSKRLLVSGRLKVTEAQFTSLAAQHSISLNVAHHAYHRLQRDYGPEMRIELTDDLRGDLHWKDIRVLNVMTNLTMLCSRRKHVHADADAIHTVLDLLLYIESCPPQSRS